MLLRDTLSTKITRILTCQDSKRDLVSARISYVLCTSFSELAQSTIATRIQDGTFSVKDMINPLLILILLTTPTGSSPGLAITAPSASTSTFTWMLWITIVNHGNSKFLRNVDADCDTGLYFSHCFEGDVERI